ncbi:unnamed protein product [Urochloa decumbens]|uniref:Rho GDP-dissociation inhibitor 1 n=1 Tax=Urochloa decumbens TaxID=240449 RepID=A0ABC9DGP5_9POAL
MSSVAVSSASSCSAKPKEELPPVPPQPQGREMEQQRPRVEERSAAVATGEQEQSVEAVDRKLSEASLCGSSAEEEEETEDDEDAAAPAAKDAIELGPRVSIKEQLDKDKDDESLRRWKQQLLGSVDLSSVGETLEPDVKITGLSILSPGRPDMVLPLPPEPKSKEPWFTLKEGSAYRLKFTFAVAGNIVSGLRYTNTVWKTGIRVDSTKQMLGTFSPQVEPYTYLTPEETTPSGIFARGSYSARTKCYLEMNYTFDIRRDWPSC